MKSSRVRPLSIPTLQMIAEKSGFSRETVSHILGGKLADRYKPSTRTKVLEIAEQLNYRPHRGAQAMKAGRSNLIAIVHFGAGIEAAHKTNLALSRMVNEKGYDYLAMDMNWYGGSVERTLAEIIRARVEGVLISHIQEVFQEEHVEELKRAGIPVVSVNGGARSNVPLICDNVEEAFRGLTRHLMNLGHRRILHLVASASHLPPGRARTINHRLTGFRTAIESRGTWQTMNEEEFFSAWPAMSEKRPTAITGVTIQQEARLYERVDKPVYRFCTRLFPQGRLPDAIVCTNDLYAMEVIAAGLEYGVRVPDHLAVTGYDNDRIGEFPAFGITTAEQDIDGICSTAVDVLMQQIARPAETAGDRMFDSRIIIRSSSAAAPAARTKRRAARQPEDSVA
ncbi:MAG TPA: LacI family DNA-binding transcriptional regulator [Terrimicrobiaceae bacterium]|nr:LacI family DNA-binding transcriptional regulator [Terrimicrobiaceae bacterium]